MKWFLYDTDLRCERVNISMCRQLRPLHYQRACLEGIQFCCSFGCCIRRCIIDFVKFKHKKSTKISYLMNAEKTTRSIEKSRLNFDGHSATLIYQKYLCLFS